MNVRRVIAGGLFFISAGAYADLVLYASGSADAGQSADATQAVSIKDSSFLKTTPDTIYGTGGDVQASGENLFPPGGPTYAIIALENIFTSAMGSQIGSGADIFSATLWVYQNENGSNGGTLSLRGLSTAASDWTEASATWNKKITPHGWDAGGDITTALGQLAPIAIMQPTI